MRIYVRSFSRASVSSLPICPCRASSTYRHNVERRARSPILFKHVMRFDSNAVELLRNAKGRVLVEMVATVFARLHHGVPLACVLQHRAVDAVQISKARNGAALCLAAGFGALPVARELRHALVAQRLQMKLSRKNLGYF